ncbi:MAG: DMT family transporter [Hyphomicrobiales bacterium]
MNNLSQNMRGAIFMTLAMLAFTLNDSMIKLTNGEVGLYQAIFLRGILATAVMGLITWKTGGFDNLPTFADRSLVWRTVGELLGTIFFLTALFNMPLANAAAILQVMPLVVTLAAAIVFREAVGWRRYTAIAVGLLGVLIIIRPGGEGFNIYSLSVLAAVFCLVLRDLSTRRINRSLSASFISFFSSAAVMVMGGIGTLFVEWQPVSAANMLQLSGSAIFLLSAYFFSIQSMRFGDVSFTSPFRYTALIWAGILGFVFFADIPDMPMIIGSLIVVASGLFTLYREHKLMVRQRRLVVRS